MQEGLHLIQDQAEALKQKSEELAQLQEDVFWSLEELAQLREALRKKDGELRKNGRQSQVREKG